MHAPATPTTFTARYDGEVLRPDTPLPLQPGQRVRLVVAEEGPGVEGSVWDRLRGIGTRHATELSPRFPDDASLWDRREPEPARHP